LLCLWTAFGSAGCFDTAPHNPIHSHPDGIFAGQERPGVIRPNGLERWYAGTEHLILWNKGARAADSLVTLRLSLDNGQTFPHVIAARIPNTGALHWTVPDLPSRQSRLQITGADTADMSDAPFAILQKPVPVQVTHEGGEWPSWRNDLIAFMSPRSGNYDIYVASIGGGEVQVTDDPSDDRYPAFDSKGSHLAFTSNRTGRDEIWATLAFSIGDTSQAQLTTGGGAQPAWRPIPNSNQLAFLSPYQEGFFNLATLEFVLEYTTFSRISTRTYAENSLKKRPSWVIAPSRKERVYYEDSGAGTSPSTVKTFRVDGMVDVPEVIALPFNGPVRHPAVSPGGTRMAVSVDGDIWIIDLVNGTAAGEPLQVTFDTADDDVPDLRSDRDMAFQSNRTGRWEIWRLTLP
jgi:Tol biopolymer transport system component